MEQLLNDVQGPGQRKIDDLPPEILHRVIKLLSPQDLKAAVLVNKRWMEVGEDPSLWTWTEIAIDTKEDIQKKLNIRRLQLLQVIRLPNGWGMGESTMTKLFKTIDEIPSVRMIHGLDLCSAVHAEPSLVARVLNRLEELYLGQWNECDYPFPIPLTPEQLKLLLTAIAEKTNVEFLCVRFSPADLSKIGPDLFGAALSNVEDVELSDSHETISAQHQEALLSAILTESSALRKLYYGMMRFDPSLDPELIGRAFNRLEDVEAYVSGEQIAAILRNLVDGESRLKKLGLVEVEPQEIVGLDQEHIRRAKDKVGDIFVYY